MYLTIIYVFYWKFETRIEDDFIKKFDSNFSHFMNDFVIINRVI